jgi:signal transduction histidine kinase
MKMNFKQRLTLSFLIIFALFTAGIIIFERQMSRRHKEEALEEKLDAYADMVAAYIMPDIHRTIPHEILELLPDNMRLTLISREGEVLYDNEISDVSHLESHADRPEVVAARKIGHGTYIRMSASAHKPFLYYAQDTGGPVIVRVALPYDVRIQSFLKTDNAFIYFIIAVFAVGIFFIMYAGNYFGKSVKRLRDFSVAIQKDSDNIDIPKFPGDELGEVGAQLVRSFKKGRENRERVVSQREKLLLHIQTLAEGVCFFHSDRSIAFYNGLFLQYFNSIAGGEQNINRILQDDSMSGVAAFLDNHDNERHYETHISKGGKDFMLKVNIFDDQSFEVTLTDITAAERTRRLKHEMTGNIAHEIRTPVTSIRGFLEIALNNNLSGEKMHDYLNRAYMQAQHLSNLISDMSLLAKIDDERNTFERTNINIGAVIGRIEEELAPAMSERHITFHADIPEGLEISGSEPLIHSVFRNLTDNAVRYAGDGVEIHVSVREVRDGFAHFSFYDTGGGVDDKHLARLFERFYRVNQGRTRDTGGSGIGLSIVKNTIVLHGGTIDVRNRANGGLEFIFSLPVAE